MPASGRVLVFFAALFSAYFGGGSVAASGGGDTGSDRVDDGNASDLLLFGFDEISGVSTLPERGRKQIPLRSTNAEIIQLQRDVVLKCGGETASQRASWLFHRCSGENHEIEKLLLTPGAADHRDRYELSSARNADKYFSFLRIKNVIAEEIAGLYRCDINLSLLVRESHYFIVGRRKSLRRCLPGADLDDKRDLFKAIQSLIRAAERGYHGGRTHEYILKLPSTLGGRTHDYKIRFSPSGDGGVRSRDAAGPKASESRRNIGNPDVIKFEISDASAPSWIENFIRGKR